MCVLGGLCIPSFVEGWLWGFQVHSRSFCLRKFWKAPFFCTNMILHNPLWHYQSFGRTKIQSQLCLCQILRKPAFSLKIKIFLVLDFLFGVNGWCLSRIGCKHYIKIVFCNSLIRHSCMWLNSVISKACENRRFYAIAVAQQECGGGWKETKNKKMCPCVILCVWKIYDAIFAGMRKLLRYLVYALKICLLKVKIDIIVLF